VVGLRHQRERGATVIGCDIAPAALRLAKTKLVTSGMDREAASLVVGSPNRPTEDPTES
jgi:methylase of polypeptide subunit release factors